MIASWIAKRMVYSMFDKAGARGDADSAFVNIADDVIYDIPLELSEGGTVHSRKAMLEWFRGWYEQFPKRKLIAKNVAFAAWPLSPRNVFMIEWTCEETDKEGKQYRYDGVGVIEMKNGKGVRATEYIACKGLPQLSALIKPTAKA
jgi:ketosteroid isomerase-like protein